MIQQIIFGVSSFTGCLKFVSKYNISPLEELDVCPLRHPVYHFFYS